MVECACGLDIDRVNPMRLKTVGPVQTRECYAETPTTRGSFGGGMTLGPYD